MKSLLNILRCPFCGGEFAQRKNFLTCECNAFPIFDGIPLLRDEPPKTLAVALGVSPRALRKLQSSTMTFRDGLKILCRDREAEYLLYRFSDPTFLRTRAVVRAVLDVIARPRTILDLCGGAGHLAFALRHENVVVADKTFWKLWLAKRFVAPRAHALCCDAEAPLPFARKVFSLAICSDAFHYIWHKRLAAEEMQRCAETIVLAHLHNARWWNYSPGMPLSPAGYAKVFEMPTGIFTESEIPLDVGAQTVDLSQRQRKFSKEPALTLIASQNKNVFRRHRLMKPQASGMRQLNPLYIRRGNGFRLKFPSRDYANEFVETTKYLPASVNGDSHEHVMLDLPVKYL